MHTKNRVSSGTKATRVEICRAVRNEASLLFPRWRWWKLNAHGGRGAEDPERKVKVARMWEPYSSQAKRKDTATGSCTFFWAVTKKMRCFTRKVVGTLFSHSCHNCLFCPSLKIHTHTKESFFFFFFKRNAVTSYVNNWFTTLSGIQSSKSPSLVSDSVTLYTVWWQDPLSKGFRHEYWSGLPCPPPRDLLRGNLPDPGMESRSPALQADSLPSEPPGKPQSPPVKTFIR